MARVKQKRNVARARALRATMPLPEVLLWRELRQQDEMKFRRQHPIGRYVLDFYCTKAKVCIEIDGMAHDLADRPTRDEKRDARLREQGITVMRVAAADVLRSPLKTAEALVLYCRR